VKGGKNGGRQNVGSRYVSLPDDGEKIEGGVVKDAEKGGFGGNRSSCRVQPAKTGIGGG